MSTSGSHKGCTNVVHRHTIRQSTHAYNKNNQVFLKDKTERNFHQSYNLVQ